MNNQNENSIELGMLAQRVLERLATDPDFRASFIRSNTQADRTAAEVTGYSLLPNPIVDPVLPNGAIDFARLLPVVKWLDYFHHLGLIGDPLAGMRASNTQHTSRKTPETELPLSGEPIVD